MTTEEKQFFDRLSDNWDENETQSTPETILEILEPIGIRKGMNILDLGTGTGILIPYLSRSVGMQGHITAVDASEGMLKRARHKYGFLENVSFSLLDFEADEIEGQFDLIFLYSVYPHLHYPQQTLKNLFDDNLKPGGKIIIAFPSDESFINNIHRERKAESDLLPSPPALAERLAEWGFNSSVVLNDKRHYLVTIQK